MEHDKDQGRDVSPDEVGAAAKDFMQGLTEAFGAAADHTDVDRLGGEAALLAQLQSQDMNLFEQYESLRQRLYNAFSRKD